jgi:hypothetical protein
VASRFDPRAFIEAELAEVSQTVAAESQPRCVASLVSKTADFCGFESQPASPLATIATLAAPTVQTRPWDAQLRRFVDQPCPADVRPDYWDELTNEALSVSKHWGTQALSAGWSALDLFACNPDPSRRRGDRDGLVKSIVDLRMAVRVVELTTTYAALEDLNQHVLRHRPSLRAAGSTFLWEAYPMIAGP